MRQRIHIVFMIQSLGVGGAEHSLVNLINAADPQEWQFSIIVFDNLVTLAPLIKPRDVVIRVVPRRGKLDWRFGRTLQQTLRELQPDVVHTHLFTADIWGTLAARRSGVPTVCTEHNINREYGWPRTLVKRWFGRRSDSYVACSAAVREYMQAVYKIEKPIRVIPNGIPLPQFLKISSAPAASPVRLAIIGRLVEQKGHAIALAALAELRRFSWQLRIVGEGPEAAALDALIKHLYLENKVSREPFTDDVAGLLAKTDIVLVPSQWEGLGVVAREAMAAARLVIASDTGGLAESIASGQTGWLVPPGNVMAWRDQIEYCLEHREENQKIAGAGRAFAARHYGVETMWAAYQRVYYDLLAKPA